MKKLIIENDKNLTDYINEPVKLRKIDSVFEQIEFSVITIICAGTVLFVLFGNIN